MCLFACFLFLALFCLSGVFFSCGLPSYVFVFIRLAFIFFFFFFVLFLFYVSSISPFPLFSTSSVLDKIRSVADVLTENRPNQFRSGVLICDIVGYLTKTELKGVSRSPQSTASVLHNWKIALAQLQLNPKFPLQLQACSSAGLLHCEEDYALGKMVPIRALLGELMVLYKGTPSLGVHALPHSTTRQLTSIPVFPSSAAASFFSAISSSSLSPTPLAASNVATTKTGTFFIPPPLSPLRLKKATRNLES